MYTVSSATGWQEKEECDVCSVPITLNQSRGRRREVLRTEVTGEGDENRWVVSVNMHKLGERFVEKVSDVRRRATVDSQATAPGESLEFLAHIRGW